MPQAEILTIPSFGWKSSNPMSQARAYAAAFDGWFKVFPPEIIVGESFACVDSRGDAALSGTWAAKDVPALIAWLRDTFE